MSPPTVTEKQISTEEMLENGYQSLFAMSLDPDIAIFDTTVQSPDNDGGDKIDITTMLRTNKRAYAPRALSMDGDLVVEGGIASGTRDQVDAVINKRGSITEWLPNGAAYSYHGYLQKATYTKRTEGEFPNGTFTFVITNTDPETGEETEPVYTPPTGTA
jgi:hypothetical protein